MKWSRHRCPQRYAPDFYQALPTETGSLLFFMMMTLYNDYKKINGFTDVSIADHDEDPDN